MSNIGIRVRHAELMTLLGILKDTVDMHLKSSNKYYMGVLLLDF